MLKTYFELIIGKMDSFMAEIYQPLLAEFKPLALAIVTLYVMISAIQIFTGRSDKPKELAFTALAAFLISVVVFNFGLYKDWLVDPVINQTLRLMGFFMGGGNSFNADNFFFAMDSNFARIFNMLDIKSNDIGWTDSWKISLVIFLLAMVYSAFYIVVSVFIITSFFALYIFFLIGGIPLFFAILPSTRFIFFAWFRAVASYALVPIFVAVVMGITLSFIVDVSDNLKMVDFSKDGIFNAVTGRAFFVAFMAMFFVFKCPEFAASLTGGQPGSSGGMLAMGITGGALMSAGILNKSKSWGGVVWNSERAKGWRQSAKSDMVHLASRAYSAVRGVSSGSGGSSSSPPSSSPSSGGTK